MLLFQQIQIASLVAAKGLEAWVSPEWLVVSRAMDGLAEAMAICFDCCVVPRQIPGAAWFKASAGKRTYVDLLCFVFKLVSRVP
jgi:hypothetical protein